MSNHWRATAVSATGTSHFRSGEACQDASRCELRGDTLLCAVSDGAGSAKHAAVGARITTGQFVEWARPISDPARIDRDQVATFLQSLGATLATEAQNNDAAISDYACTLLGVIATPGCMVAVQLGDGAIVIPTIPAITDSSAPSSYMAVFWPQHGEFANTTNFVTQANAADIVEVSVLPPVDAFALFSDGLERLILHAATRTVHAPAHSRSSNGSARTPRRTPTGADGR
jgi:hypothetical protein